MRLLKAYRIAMQWLWRAAVGICAAVLVAQTLLLAFSCVQGIGGWRGQALWLTEVVEHGLLTLCFLGAGAALRSGAHQGVDVLTRQLPPRWRRLAGGVQWVVVAAFSGVFAHCGLLYVLDTARTGGALASVELPKWPFYLCYPVGGALMALFAVEGLLGLIVGDRGEPGTGGTGPSAPPGPAARAGAAP